MPRATHTASLLTAAALEAGVDSVAERLLTALRTNASDSLKEAVRRWYDRLLTQLRTADPRIADREVLLGGEWATEIASFEWTLVPVGGGAAVTDRGTYVPVWHHEADGRWLFARELWNGTAPPGR